MKKILSITLALAMMFTLAACGSSKQEPTTAATEITETAAKTSPVDAISLDDILYLMGDMNPDTYLGSYSHQPITEEDAGFVIGYENFSGKFESAMALMPAINVDPFVMILFRLAEGADAEAFADDLQTNANPGKWVCVRAESVTTLIEGRTVLFMMSSQDLVKPVTDTFTTISAEGFDVDAHMVKPLSGKTAQDVYDDLYAAYPVEDFGFADNTDVTPVSEDTGFGLGGLDLSKVQDSVVDDGYAPATEEDGERAYVLAIFHLNDGEDAAAFAQEAVANLDTGSLQGEGLGGVVCYGDGFVIVFSGTGNNGTMATALQSILPIEYRITAEEI